MGKIVLGVVGLDIEIPPDIAYKDLVGVPVSSDGFGNSGGHVGGKQEECWGPGSV